MADIEFQGTGGIVEGNLEDANVNVNLDQCNSFNETGYKMNSTSYFTSSFDDVTIMFWATRDDLTDTTSDRLFTANGGNDLRIYLQNDVLRFRHTFADDTVSEACQFNLTNEINNDDWFHIAAVYDGSGGIDKLFLNGVQKSSVSVSKNLKALSSATDAWSIARRVSTTAESYAGKIADCKIYSTALSEAEIKIAASKINKDPTLISSTAPVGYWPIVGTTIDVTDNSGSNDMTALGTPTVTYDKFSVDVYAGSYFGASASTTTDGTFTVTQGKAECKALTSVDFDGTDDHVDTSNTFLDNTDFTIACWIRHDGTQENSLASIVDSRQSGSNGCGLSNHGSDNTIRLRINSNDITTPSNSITDNTWHHIVAGRDANNNTFIYIDGVLQASGSSSATLNSSTGLHIAGAPYSTAAEFGGKIRDVKLFDYGLSAEQAASLYSGTYPQTPSHHYKLDEGSGTTASDTGTATASDGTLTNGPTYSNGTLDLDYDLVTATNGTFSAPRGTVTLVRNFQNSGTFIHNSGTFEAVSGDNTLINTTGTAPITFHNVLCSGGAFVFIYRDTTVENELHVDSSTVFKINCSSRAVTLTMGTTSSAGEIHQDGGGFQFTSNTSNVAAIVAADTSGLNPWFNASTGFNFDWDSGGSGSNLEIANGNYNGDTTTGGGGVTVTLTGNMEFDGITVSAGDFWDINGKRMETSGVFNIADGGDVNTTNGGLLVVHDSLQCLGAINGSNGLNVIADGGNAHKWGLGQSGGVASWADVVMTNGTCTHNSGVLGNAGGAHSPRNLIVGNGTFTQSGGTTTMLDITVATGGIFTPSQTDTTVTCEGDFTTSGGLIGKSGLDFDGSGGDRVNFGSDSSIDNLFADGATAEFWIKPESDGEGNFGRILDKTNWIINVREESSDVVRINFTHAFSSSSGSWKTQNRVIPLNKWSHVAITYDGSSVNNDPIIYVNGKSVPLTEGTTPAGSVSGDSSTDLIMGNNSSGDRTFDGVIDMARLFDDVRSPSEIRNNMFSQLGSSEGGLVAQWVLDEGKGGNGATTADSSANSNTGTLGPAGNAPNWVGAGTFTQGSSTLVFAKSGTQTFTYNVGGEDVNNLTVNDGSTTNLKCLQDTGGVLDVFGNLVVNEKLGVTVNEQIKMKTGDKTITIGSDVKTSAVADLFSIQLDHTSGNINIPELTTKKITCRASSATTTATGDLTLTSELEVNSGATFNANGKTITSKLVDMNGTGTFTLGASALVLNNTSGGLTSESGVTLNAGPGCTIGGDDSGQKVPFESQNGFQIVGDIDDLNVTNEELTVVGTVTNCTGDIIQFTPGHDTTLSLETDTAEDRDIRLGGPSLDNANHLIPE